MLICSSNDDDEDEDHGGENGGKNDVDDGDGDAGCMYGCEYEQRAMYEQYQYQ
jgi:hypothetical protein